MNLNLKPLLLSGAMILSMYSANPVYAAPASETATASEEELAATETDTELSSEEDEFGPGYTEEVVGENELLDLYELYSVEDDGTIVADFLSDEEVEKLKEMVSENEKSSGTATVGSQTKNGGTGQSQAAISYALSKVGVPYSQARRNSGKAFDCSSLIYYSYLNSNVDLSYNGSNTAASMAHGLVSSGHEVSSADLQPGDLIFYSGSRNGRYHNITHVAMYVGDGLQVEASSSNHKVVVRGTRLQQAVNICRPVM